MDKQTIIFKISSASINKELKTKLLEMVNSAQEITPELITALKAAISQSAEEQIDQIAALEVEDAINKYQQDLIKLNEQIDQFGKELNSQAEKIDLDEARKKVSAS